jgi:hypothetical protein
LKIEEEQRKGKGRGELTTLVTSFKAVIRRGFRSRLWKTRCTISTKCPSRTIDFLDGNLDAGVDGYEACDVGVEVYFCLEVINIKSRDDLVVCSTCLGSVCMDLLYPSD